MKFERKSLPERHYIYVDREASFSGGNAIAEAMAIIDGLTSVPSIRVPSPAATAAALAAKPVPQATSRTASPERIQALTKASTNGAMNLAMWVS